MQFFKRSLLLLGALLPIINAAPAEAGATFKSAPAEKIANKYIIKFKEGVDVAAHTAWATDLQKRSNLAKREADPAAVSIRF
jgi:hypothetical protein